jgi:hypothetical protein
MKKNNILLPLKLILWSGRALSLLFFLIWGAFFIEHIEFFINGSMHLPFFVYLFTMIHLLLLVSYLISLWKHFVGSIMIIITALIFFSLTAGKMFILFFLVSSTPAMFYLYYWKRSKSIIKTSQIGIENE